MASPCSWSGNVTPKPIPMFSFRMLSDTRIECQHASQEWKASPVGAISDDRGGVEPGSTSPAGMDSCQVGNFNTGFTYGCGVVYEFVPGSGGNWTETILYSFVRGNGSAVNPSGGLLFDKAGHLYA